MCAQGRAVPGNLARMNRRHFLYASMALSTAFAKDSSPAPMDVREFHATRKFVPLSGVWFVFVERGCGPAALFLHGYPLNGYQWRGALSRLSNHRRCIALDFLGLGYTEVPEGADLSPGAQTTMLARLLDHLGEDQVDIVANDSGGAVAQLFVARYPKRVRTLLLTNCDTTNDCPPQAIASLIADVRKGGAAEKYIAQPLKDPASARSPQGLVGACFTYPDRFRDDTLECYLGAFTKSPLRMKQYEQFALALEKNVLAGVESALQQFPTPKRILWGTADTIFSAASPELLSRTKPKTRNKHHNKGAKLFWPEEFPELIAAEARTLWG